MTAAEIFEKTVLSKWIICDERPTDKTAEITGTAILRPYSPDFFLKERIYSNNPQSLEELKHNSEKIATSTDPETLHSYMEMKA
jgi:hypothetical protein